MVKLKFLCLSPFQRHPEIADQGEKRQGRRGDSGAGLANPGLVPSTFQTDGGSAFSISTDRATSVFAGPSQDGSSSAASPQVTGMQSIRENLTYNGLSDQAAELVLASWRPATKKLYDVYINKWMTFAKDNNCSVFNPTIQDVVNFLADLFQKGAGYSVINSARCSLSAFLPYVDGKSVGSHSLVCRLLKGVFAKRPSLPKYTLTWDVGMVLRYLASLPSTEELSLKMLTYRLVMLLCLLTGQRGHALYQLKLSDCHVDSGSTKLTIVYTSIHKCTTAKSHTKPSVILAYPFDPNLCAVKHFKMYVEKTKHLRKQDVLFLTLLRPHKAIARATYSRWVKDVLSLAGVDTDVFSPHSTRSASTSAALSAGAPLDVILDAAAWASDLTFTKFYKRDCAPKINFSQAVYKSAGL